MHKSVKCPDCGATIDLGSALYDEIKENINANVEAKVSARTVALSSELEEIHKLLHSTTKQLAEHKTNELLLKNRLSSIEEEVELKVQDRLSSEMLKAKQVLESTNSLQLKERDTLIDQLKVQLAEVQRRAEQGSMQLQGEVQELLIEEFLRESFPFDDVREIKKGSFGADCIQIINTRNQIGCGSIYYESKRTKEFSRQWISKLKEDMISCGANIGVLVTNTMPKELEQFGQINGIWVCNLNEFKALSYVLREMVINVNNALSSQENKGEKMEILYNYLTSNEFKMTIDGIVEGFVQMSEDLESEKRSMNLIWKKREKQIQTVINNTVSMYGSLKGIAGSAIADIERLQLPVGE